MNTLPVAGEPELVRSLRSTSHDANRGYWPAMTLRATRARTGGRVHAAAKAASKSSSRRACPEAA
jgi:hypothetical protein